MTKPKPAKHGGARTGAGRPKGPSGTAKGRTRPILRTTVAPETMAALRASGQPMGLTIDAAMRANPTQPENLK